MKKLMLNIGVFSSSWLVRAILCLILGVFVIDASAELITAGIMAGSAIISGLLGLYGNSQASGESAAAQREANATNLALYEGNKAEEQRRWDASEALARINAGLAKEQYEWNQDQMLEKKSYDRAFDISNRLITLANAGQTRGQNLATQWAQQSRLNG